jgi:hypothetical protein
MDGAMKIGMGNRIAIEGDNKGFAPVIVDIGRCLAKEIPGEVAEGEIITTPFGTATFVAIAPVTPEQSAPIIARQTSCLQQKILHQLQKQELKRAALYLLYR